MSSRILVPGRVLPAGAAGRHETLSVGIRYLEAVERAGGFPCPVAPRPVDRDGALALLAGVAAIVLTGGADIDPARYGAEASPHTYGVDPVRDGFELTLLHAAVALGLPVLAVCRGLQLVNVAFGGTLCQHIVEEFPRRLSGFPAPEPGANGPLVEVALTAGSRAAIAIGALSIVGAHSHHQAIETVGSRLAVTGRATDGLAEVVEPADPDAPWLVGVQWHPEDTAATDPANQRLFDALVRAAGARTEGARSAPTGA